MQNTLLMVFTGVLALAVVLQTLVFFAIYRTIRRISVWMDSCGRDLLRNAEVISSKVEEGLTTLKSTAESLKPITQNLVGATQIVHNRVVELDNFLAQATNTARLEIMRIQETIQLASRRFDETMDILRKSILAPIGEIGAIARAIRVSFDVLFRRRRNFSNTSAQDEEMFI